MFKIDGKYGNVHINGMSIDIEKTKILLPNYHFIVHEKGATYRTTK